MSGKEITAPAEAKEPGESTERRGSTESKDSRAPKRNSKGRVFQCTGYPNCNKSFTRSEHLARHRRKHTGERPFSCPHCSKHFSRLDNLRQHKQTVHAYESYSKVGSESTSPKYPYSQNSVHHQTHPTPVSGVESVGGPKTPQVYMPIKPTGSPPGPTLRPLLPHDSKYGPMPSSAPGSAANQIVSPPLSGSSVYHTYPASYYSETPTLSQIPNRGPSSGLGSLAAASAVITAEAEAASLDSLRDPPKFNPKSRPRPLSLMQSFSDDNFHNRGIPAPPMRIDAPLKTAPPLAGFALPYLYDSNRPMLRPLLAGTMVSPLSPLFRQSFNQVAFPSPMGSAPLPSVGGGQWPHKNGPSNFQQVPPLPNIKELPNTTITSSITRDNPPLYRRNSLKDVVHAEPPGPNPAPERKVNIHNLLSDDTPSAEEPPQHIRVENC